MSKLKLYKEGCIDDVVLQGEMAAVELDAPEVEGVTYGQGSISRAWRLRGMWRPSKNATRW